MERGLHSFATRHCGIPTHQLLPSLRKSHPSLTAATPHPEKQRSLKQAASFWGVPWPKQSGLGLPVCLLRVKFEGSNFFLQLSFSQFIWEGVLCLPSLPDVSDLTRFPDSEMAVIMAWDVLQSWRPDAALIVLQLHSRSWSYLLWNMAEI